MTIDNLPSWPGAAECYSRAYAWTNELARRAYAAAKDKRKWILPEDVADMIRALDEGDEETIKALNHRHRDLWL